MRIVSFNMHIIYNVFSSSNVEKELFAIKRIKNGQIKIETKKKYFVFDNFF